MSNSKIVFGYWNLRGLAQPIRFLSAYLGIELDEKLYYVEKREEWLEKDKKSLGLEFPNLPYLIDGDVRLTESRAILKYLARKYGKNMVPSREQDIQTLDIIDSVLWDIWINLIRYLYSALEPQKRLVDGSSEKFQQLEKFLQGKKYIMGSQITYIDFILHEIIHAHLQWQPDYFDKYPNLKRFKKEFDEIPEIKKHKESKNYIKGPCVAPFAAIPI